MMKIMVTGASGHLGRQTIEFLRQRVSTDRIVALARDPDVLWELAASGIEVRRGDYADAGSFLPALRGIDKILLVSAAAFTDRISQHRNVIAAAKEAGVRHLIYTSIQRGLQSTLTIPMVTESDIATEDALKVSGLDYTILFNSLYLDAVPMMLGDTIPEGDLHAPGGTGRGALVARRDLAEANAVILSEPGHENRSYILGASEAVSLADIAAIFASIVGRPVRYIETAVQEYVDAKIALGFPQPAAAFLAQWVNALGAGEFSEITLDLERLIGRKPTSCRDFLIANYPRRA